MCFYIAAALLRGRPLVIGDEEKRHLHALKLECRTLETYFGPERDLWFLTSGSCSCDLYCHPESPEDARKEHAAKEARLLRRYEKKGWSKSKIERALHDWRQAHPLPPDNPDDRIGLSVRARKQIALSAHESPVHVVVHEFRGYVADEEFTVRQGPRLSPERFLAGRDLIEVDTDYCLT